MDIIDAIYQRMSIRDFLPDPVPAETLEEILTAACRSPSAMNSQPWEFVVLTGAPLDRIREENVSRLDAGEPPASEHSVVGWPRPCSKSWASAGRKRKNGGSGPGGGSGFSTPRRR